VCDVGDVPTEKQPLLLGHESFPPNDDADEVPLTRAIVILVVVEDGCGRNFCFNMEDDELRLPSGISILPLCPNAPDADGATSPILVTLAVGTAPPRTDDELDRGYGNALELRCCLDEGDEPLGAAAASFEDKSDVRDLEIDDPLLATLVKLPATVCSPAAIGGDDVGD
jgi:hypothetical protein